MRKTRGGKKRELVNSCELFVFFWISSTLLDLISHAEAAIWALQGNFLVTAVLFSCFFFSLLGLISDQENRYRNHFLICALSLQVIYTVITAPEIPNHRLLCALVNISLVVELFKKKSFASISSTFINTAKILAAATYGFAFFHKLNSDYINPQTSCATLFTDDLIKSYANLSWIYTPRALVPIVSLIAEGLLFLTIFLPSKFAVLIVSLGFVFHSFLALHSERHFFDFSAVMMSLLFLFVPTQRKFAVPAVWLKFLLAIGFSVSFILLLRLGDFEIYNAALQVRIRVWALFSLVIAFYFYQASTRLEKTPTLNFLKLGSLNIALVYFAILSGVSPYLGLKTRYSFDMYSNLRVENAETNHLIFPASLLGGVLSNDLLEVIEVNGKTVIFPIIRNDILVPGKRIVRFYLASILARTPGLSVKVRDNGLEKEFRSASEVYSNGWVPNWLLRKLLAFRPVEPANVPVFCQW